MSSNRLLPSAPHTESLQVSMRLFVAASYAAFNIFVIVARHVLDSSHPVMGVPNEELRIMDDRERDGAITIDVAFGNITFCRDESETFVQVVADMSVKGASHDRIEMAIRIPASHHESIIDIVDKSRRQIVQLLNAAAARIETETAETLLYGKESSVSST